MCFIPVMLKIFRYSARLLSAPILQDLPELLQRKIILKISTLKSTPAYKKSNLVMKPVIMPPAGQNGM